MAVRSQNKTKVGLKDDGVCPHSCRWERQNKTKVGLKGTRSLWLLRTATGQNKTKVGLKVKPLNLFSKKPSVRIRLR